MTATPDVFLLCTAGSLSNRLNRLLARHPLIYPVPDLGLAHGVSISEWLAPSPGRTHHGLLRTVARLFSGEETLESVEMARRWLRRRGDRPAWEVRVELVRRVAPGVLVERMMVDSRSAAQLAELGQIFPGAKFIHLIRHPLASGVAMMQTRESVTALWQQRALLPAKRSPGLDPQVVWHAAHAVIGEFLETQASENVIRIRAEDVGADPDAILAAVCEWLGLSPADAGRESVWPYEFPGPYNAMGGVDWEPVGEAFAVSPSLEESLPWAEGHYGLREEVKELARSFGYE